VTENAINEVNCLNTIDYREVGGEKL